MALFSQGFDERAQKLGTIASLLGLILVIVWAYYPGLGGPFIFDDFGTIPKLGYRGGVVDWDTFKAFVLGGDSGPTGRPISLLTFLVDGNNWPTEASPFKRTNLVIHCLCGVMLALLTRQLLLALRYDARDIHWLVITAAGIWLLHPFLVSTTLYVVQRMTQLSTLFVLAGLYFYVRGRMLLPSNPRAAYIQMSAAIALFTLLATFAKENGSLLPLLAATIEITVFASQREALGRLNRIWATAFLALPAVAFLLYLGGQTFKDDFFEIVPPRDFSMYERALTQPRILFDYLNHWFIPKLYTTGIFQDHYLKSTGLLSPVTTILSLCAHAFILTFAVLKRRHWPLFAFAVLFFYTSHLLESTVVNLELYFEHRNYLATGFLFLPLLAALNRKVARRHYILICLALMASLGGFTRYSSSVWASWPTMVEVSARKLPTSERAQAQYSVLLFRAGRHEESLEVLRQALDVIPGPNALLRVNRLISLCQLSQLSGQEFDREAHVLSQLQYDPRLIRVYSTLADNVVTKKCPDVTSEQLADLFTRMLRLPYNNIRESHRYSQIQYLIGFAEAYSGRPDEAVAAFIESLRARPGASHAMLMAAVLAGNQFGEEALQLSNLALALLEKSTQSMLDEAPVSRTDIHIFQDIVRADIKALQDADNSRADQ